MVTTCTPLFANVSLYLNVADLLCFSNVRRPFSSDVPSYARFEMNKMAVVMPIADTTYPSSAPECTPIVQFISTSM